MPKTDLLYHLEPCFRKDRALVPEEAMPLRKAEQKRAELRALGIEVRRPVEVGKSPIRNDDGFRKSNIHIERPRRSWDGEDIRDSLKRLVEAE